MSDLWRDAADASKRTWGTFDSADAATTAATAIASYFNAAGLTAADMAWATLEVNNQRLASRGLRRRAVTPFSFHLTPI
jgi:hypothetical protein